MDSGKIGLLVLCFANFCSFAWSVVGVFRHYPEQDVCLYRLLQVTSVSIWVCSFLTILTSQSSNLTLTACTLVIELSALALFWAASRTVKKGHLTVVFSKDLPEFLITDGPYRLVRHPFYTSYLVSYGGVLVYQFSWIMFGLVMAMTAIYLVAADKEEGKFLRSKLADSYTAYSARTGRFFPKFF